MTFLCDCQYCQLTQYAYLFSCQQDYKTYLDFVLALENRREPQALQYLFRLLDVQNKGYLNVFDLNYFFRVRHRGLNNLIVKPKYLSCIIQSSLYIDTLCQKIDLIFCTWEISHILPFQKLVTKLKYVQYNQRY